MTLEESILKQALAIKIEHTAVKAAITSQDVIRLCREAKQYNFVAVAVNPSYVSLAVRELQESETEVCAAIGFPLGATTLKVKTFEAEEALKNGAKAIDMVINLGALKSGDYSLVEREIKSIVKIGESATTKIIIEACYLNKEEKIRLSQMAKDLGVDFIKTSTGMGSSGATVEDVKLIRAVVGPEMGIKAAGGIHSYNEAKRLIEAGADRIGTSQGVKIMREYLESIRK
ncbi:MAG: deoxyribose-phosphate aldolase [Candidatus Aerophobetes bacterium]|nr:deoxyribose-phosphate aldolase [Candidatus Aerophobetes bacterium]